MNIKKKLKQLIKKAREIHNIAEYMYEKAFEQDKEKEKKGK